MESDHEAPFGWRNLLSLAAGVVPFIIFGPCIVLLSYLFPYPAWMRTSTFQTIEVSVILGIILSGFAVGWFQRFPLWSYPYFCIVAWVLCLGGISLTNQPFRYEGYGLMLVTVVLVFGIFILFLYLTRHNLPLNDLIRDIRADWTRISLGLLIVPTFFFSSIEHEEDPILTPFVIGPSIVLLLTVLTALIVQKKQTRFIVLAAGMLLAILVRLPSGKFFYLFYWLVSAAIVFAPSLMDIAIKFRKPGKEIG